MIFWHDSIPKLLIQNDEDIRLGQPARDALEEHSEVGRDPAMLAFVLGYYRVTVAAPEHAT